MIKIDTVNVWGFQHAIRGMRNPLNSWTQSDSDFSNNAVKLGTKDLELMRRLFTAGESHRKYLRQIFISLDITAPLYWWKEMDQYRINVTTNSCSTMHNIHKKEFELSDFSTEHLIDDTTENFETSIIDYAGDLADVNSMNIMDMLIQILNCYREYYISTKDKRYWWQMIQLLPSSYNQKRTITMSYENAVNMIEQREGHKLDEWREFVNELKHLPYLQDIMEGVSKDEAEL